MNSESTLAQRLGVSVHVSPLRFKLRKLSERYPSADATCLEEWLVDVANARGARIVARPRDVEIPFTPPTEEDLPNEELVVAICQPQCRDYPQMLRLAAQLISRRAVRFRVLRLAAERERAGLVLGELARQALRVDPDHDLWRSLAEQFPLKGPLRSPILHWTRLAQPIMANGRCNAAGWKLVT